MPSLQTQDTAATLKDSSDPSDELTGRTGSARLRQKAIELRFFPACEPQLFMVLNYLSAKLWRLQDELEQLERGNRAEDREDYKENQPDNDYGKQKDALMEELTQVVKTYFEIFNNANGVLSQPSPNIQYVNGFRRWASYHLSSDPADERNAADNYRFVGPRPSNIDTSFHSFIDGISTIWPFTNKTGKSKRSSTDSKDKNGKENEEEEREKEEEEEAGIVVIEHSNALFRGFSNAVIITFAFVFILLPPTLVCLTNMSDILTVLVMVAFCLCFFMVIVFLFASLTTEHKFLLFFAYCGAMVTMLSGINRNDVLIQGLAGKENLT